MGIVQEWIIKTRAVRPRSAELIALDNAVSAWARLGQGIRDINMKNTWDKLSAWKTAKPAEYTKIQIHADALENELANEWTNKPTVMTGFKSTGTQPMGWSLEPFDANTWGAMTDLPVGQHVAALTATEIAKINESFRRVKLAIRAAREAILTVAKRKKFTGTVPPEEQAYLDFFGTYDEKRLQKVVGNICALALAFEGTPKLTDVRNKQLWSTTYGGCGRQNLVTKDKHKVLGLSGSVDMLFGRAFLSGAGYAATTDGTVGTLVHEFAHGTFGAVDVPEVDASGNFQCTRESDDPKAANFGNSTDPHGHQSSTEADDKLLAKHKPEYALVNADNYAQFTKVILLAKKK